MIYQFPNYPERKGLRCKDCKHFGHGRMFPNRYDKTGQVCFRKPKFSKNDHVIVRCYYAACWLDKVCDMYEPKETEQ